MLKMDFCHECGSRLTQKKSKTGEKIKISLECLKCGVLKKEIKKVAPPEIIKKKEETQKFFTVITKEEQKLNTLPTLKVECHKCGNKKVYVWQVQTRGGDESSTQFMRCTKCNHTFREYT
jgi:DNA-directed RNA polymerase subunit M